MRNIGIAGTFDIQNYGDLLFPLVAEAELTKRLGPINLRRFSYNAKQPPDWPYSVTPVADLPLALGDLNGMLIGGGHLIRFDKEVAPGYRPASADIHHPTGYWLMPALLALQQGCPVAWNAPGAVPPFPPWAEPLLRLAIAQSDYVAVRDEPTRSALAKLAPGKSIALVPDTCFGISRIVDARRPSAEFLELREAAGLTRPFVIVQASPESAPFCEFLRKHGERLGGYQFVVLPMGPVLGDEDAVLTGEWAHFVRLPVWPDPFLLTELIANAAGVVGLSLHLAIAALSYGVPVFRPRGASDGKFAVLLTFESVHAIPEDGASEPGGFLEKLSQRRPDRRLPGVFEALDRHWDTVAQLFTAQAPRVPKDIFAGLEARLPGLLEMEARFADEVARSRALLDAQSARDRQIAELSAALAQREQQIGALTGALGEREQQVGHLTAAACEREQRIAQLEPLVHVPAQAEQLHRIVQARNEEVRALRQSTSWKVTVPLRWVRTLMGGASGANIVRFDRLEQQALSREPYDWAFANGLFAQRDAQALVATYPRDHFKTVKGYDGEKGYEYESRPLIHLGAHDVSHAGALSSAWKRLAHDLLSPDYRAAVTQLTGRDLMSVPMEAYVCHFGPGAWLGPHLDLKDKIMTHVFYFNETWDPKDGGCLNILRSSDMADSIAEIAPIVGNSSVLVRADNSWHAVTRVVNGCRTSRRSMNVIFYRPGAKSTMWPPGETPQFHDYVPPEG